MTTDRQIVYLNPRDLLPSRENVRSDPGDLAGLAETIREHGLLQPLGVNREADAYRLVYGHRRRDAAIVVGLNRVPCLVIDASNDDQVVVQQVLENLQRLDLNDLDKARAFDRLLGRMVAQGRSQGEALDAMARTLGLSVRQIQRYLRLLQLGAEAQRLVARGELGVTQAQHLVGLLPVTRQEAVASLASEENLSAAELSRLCGALEHNLSVDPRLALEMLRLGQRVPTIETVPAESVRNLGAPPRADEGAGEAFNREDRDDDRAAGPDPFARGPGGTEGGDYGRLEPTTQDGNRVRRIHSLDAFADEVQRLTRCVQEGDLQRFLGEGEMARLKIGLAARQLRFLAEAVGAIARADDLPAGQG